MVHLAKLLLYRTPRRPPRLKVTRQKPLAQGAECLFAGDDTVSMKSSLDGVTNLSSTLVMRLAKDGCTNRPFYRIVVAELLDPRSSEMEQLGTFDPMPNTFNEKMCALNYDRIKHHLAHGVHVTKPVRRLLGLSGFLPLDPTLLIFAENLRRRRHIEKLKLEQLAKEEQESSSELAS